MKTALVLVPGLLCDRRLWQHQVENLGEITQPVVADVTGSDTIEELAHAVLRAAPDRFVLAGLSLGGYVAQWAREKSPIWGMRLSLSRSMVVSLRDKSTPRERARRLPAPS